MKRFQFVLSILILVLVMGAGAARAEDHPIQLALFNPVQIFPEQDDIRGIRLSLIYGKNASVSGIDWGLINHTTSGESMGWQSGLVSLNEGDFVGFQYSGVNIVEGSFEGFQWAVVNHANHASGLQLGFVNYARTLHGLQIGFVNIIGEGGAFPVLPIINWSF